MLDNLDTSSKRPLGFWATFGFGTAVVAVFFIAQLVAGFIFGIAIAIKNTISHQELNLLKITDTINASEGLLASLAIITSALVCTCMIIAVVGMRKNNSISEYLCLKIFSLKGMLLSLVAVIALIVANVLASEIFDRPSTTQVMLDYYNTSIWPPIFWIAIIIFAPIFEEFFFRGFLFKGFSQSRIGIIGTIILTSLGWALLHQQYEVFELVFIFILGILLGVIRHKTGSLWITVILHSLWNLIGVIGLAINNSGIFS